MHTLGRGRCCTWEEIADQKAWPDLELLQLPSSMNLRVSLKSISTCRLHSNPGWSQVHTQSAGDLCGPPSRLPMWIPCAPPPLPPLTLPSAIGLAHINVSLDHAETGQFTLVSGAVAPLRRRTHSQDVSQMEISHQLPLNKSKRFFC